MTLQLATAYINTSIRNNPRHSPESSQIQNGGRKLKSLRIWFAQGRASSVADPVHFLPDPDRGSCLKRSDPDPSYPTF